MRQIPIYWINLASRPDRRAFMEEQFERLGLKAERIEAVCRSDISAEQINLFCNPSRRWSMTVSRLACNLSHMRAWETLLSARDERAVIFEDDALLSPLLPEFLSKSPMQKAWPALIRLEKGNRPGYYLAAENATANVRLRERTTWDIGSAGYLLSADAARWLLSEPALHRQLVDDVLFTPFSKVGRRLAAKSTDPALCVQVGGRESMVGKSTLNETGEDAEHKKARKQRPLVKFSRHAEVWFLQDIPEGAMSAAARWRATRMKIPFAN